MRSRLQKKRQARATPREANPMSTRISTFSRVLPSTYLPKKGGKREKCGTSARGTEGERGGGWGIESKATRKELLKPQLRTRARGGGSSPLKALLPFRNEPSEGGLLGR